MRKLILQEWISLDGFAADQAGTTEFFNKPRYNEDLEEDLLQFMDRVDTILLGAKTYQLFVQYWPTADPKQEIIADQINLTPKVVFSQSLDQAPWGDWPVAAVMKADLIETITHLKQQPGKDMVLWGSLSVAHSLIEAGLIDEYQLRVVPIVLGSGRLLFGDRDKPVNLHLLESKPYPSGITLLRYGATTPAA